MTLLRLCHVKELTFIEFINMASYKIQHRVEIVELMNENERLAMNFDRKLRDISNNTRMIQLDWKITS